MCMYTVGIRIMNYDELYCILHIYSCNSPVYNKNFDPDRIRSCWLRRHCAQRGAADAGTGSSLNLKSCAPNGSWLGGVQVELGDWGIHGDSWSWTGLDPSMQWTKFNVWVGPSRTWSFHDVMCSSGVLKCCFLRRPTVLIRHWAMPCLLNNPAFQFMNNNWNITSHVISACIFRDRSFRWGLCFWPYYDRVVHGPRLMELPTVLSEWLATLCNWDPWGWWCSRCLPNFLGWWAFIFSPNRVCLGPRSLSPDKASVQLLVHVSGWLREWHIRWCGFRDGSADFGTGCGLVLGSSGDFGGSGVGSGMVFTGCCHAFLSPLSCWGYHLGLCLYGHDMTLDRVDQWKARTNRQRHFDPA